MTPTLTSADPAGWYLCCDNQGDEVVMHFDGHNLRRGPSIVWRAYPLAAFSNFSRLIESPDWPRLRAWAADPNRKPPALAFSAGVERDVADMMVMMMPNCEEIAKGCQREMHCEAAWQVIQARATNQAR